MQFVIVFSKKRDSLKMSILPAWRQSYQILIFKRIFKGTTYIPYFSLTHRHMFEEFDRYVLYFRSFSLTLDFSKIFINILWGLNTFKNSTFLFLLFTSMIWYNLYLVNSTERTHSFHIDNNCYQCTKAHPAHLNFMNVQNFMWNVTREKIFKWSFPNHF